MRGAPVKLLLVAGILVGLVLVFANPFQNSIHEDLTDRPQYLEGIDVTGADRITIRAPGAKPVVLEDRSGSWVVASENGFPADTTAVGTILRGVGGAISTGVASRNPENRAKFQVDSTGVEVTVASGDQERAHLFVGKMGRDFTTSYVRAEGSEEVHVVRGLNRNIFTRPQGFRDRTLFRFEPETVASFRAEMPGGGWTLVRSDSAWTAVPDGENGDGAPAPDSAVDPILRAAGALAADGFFAGSADTLKAGLETPDYRFTVRLLNGVEASVAVGASNGNDQRYVRRGDRDTVYLLADWRVTGLAKPYEDLVGD